MSNNDGFRGSALRGAVRLLVLLLAATCFGACQPFASTSRPPAPTPTPTAPTITWDELRQRPLHLLRLAPSAPCPKLLGHVVSPDFGPVLGDGPVYPAIGSDTGIMRTGNLNKVLWIIAPTYTSLVLIRGHQVDGLGTLTFNGGIDQSTYQGDWHDAPRLPDLRLMDGAGEGTPWANFPTYTNVPAPGCYGYQVDGASFSYPIIFEATADQPKGGA